MNYVAVTTQETICTHCGRWHSLSASGHIEPHKNQMHEPCPGSNVRPTKKIRIVRQTKVQL